jgi:hypothetical protein
MKTPLQIADEESEKYLKDHPCCWWCPVCGTIYLFKFAPVLTTLAALISALIGLIIARL